MLILTIKYSCNLYSKNEQKKERGYIDLIFLSLSLSLYVYVWYFLIDKDCIKKWKGLRDSYMKEEKKKEKERTRSGAGRTVPSENDYFVLQRRNACPTISSNK